MASGTNEPVGENGDMMELHEASESSAATDDEEQVLIVAETFTFFPGFTKSESDQSICIVYFPNIFLNKSTCIHIPRSAHRTVPTHVPVLNRT